MSANKGCSNTLDYQPPFLLFWLIFDAHGSQQKLVHHDQRHRTEEAQQPDAMETRSRDHRSSRGHLPTTSPPGPRQLPSGRGRQNSLTDFYAVDWTGPDEESPCAPRVTSRPLPSSVWPSPGPHCNP